MSMVRWRRSRCWLAISSKSKRTHDLRYGLIGAGVYASHGYERSHVDGAVAALKVLAGYIE